MKNFGAFLRNARYGLMTQRQLANKIGVGHPYISKLESNVESNPSEELLLKIAEALLLDVDEVFYQGNRIPKDLTDFLLGNVEAMRILRFFSVNSNLISQFERFLEVREDVSSCESFYHNPKCILIVDPDNGEIVNANLTASRFYQYPLEELIGMPITDINILSVEEIQEAMKNVKLELRNYFIFKHKLKNSEIKTVEVYSDPIKIKDKTYLYSIIKERKC